MKGRLISLTVLAGMLLSFVGAAFGHENLKTIGNLTLLVVATIAGYHFLRFQLLNPVHEVTGVCLNKTRSGSGYRFTVKTGRGELFNGESGEAQGEKIKIGEKCRFKVKGSNIVEIEKLVAVPKSV
jgi:hypothetical protein